MKIAISGKGGVGKSTVAAAIALSLARRGERVLALDADPDANLASALGISGEEQEKIVPIAQQLALIEERTGAKVNEYGKVFRLNPEVSDVAEKFAYAHNGIELLVLGGVKGGGTGCACPENTFIRALVTDLILYKNQSLVMDMEAGIEHLGRGTAQGVDVMLVVLEPGKRSVDCAKTVMRMCAEIGIQRLLFVANKISYDADIDYLKTALPDVEFTAFLPYSEALRAADRDGLSVLDSMTPEVQKGIEAILAAIGG